jgi:hypothetical protein
MAGKSGSGRTMILGYLLHNQWQELLQIASSIQLSDEEDVIIWQYNSSGKYSVCSLYAIINDKGLNMFLLVLWGKFLFHLDSIFFCSF